MLGTSEARNENHSDEVPIADGDLDYLKAKSSRTRPKVKAVKLTAAVADMVADIPSTIVGRASAKDKKKQEVQAAALLQKRKALVERQMMSAAIGTSNLGENSSLPVRHSSGQPSEEPEVQDGGKTDVVDPGLSELALNFCNIREFNKMNDHCYHNRSGKYVGGCKPCLLLYNKGKNAKIELTVCSVCHKRNMKKYEGLLLCKILRPHL